MQTDDKTLNPADKRELISKLERLMETYRQQIGSGWITVFAQTVKIDATDYLA